MPLRPVDPQTVKNKGPGHRGRVGYPLLKEFMESGSLVSAVDDDGMQNSPQSLRASMKYHIDSKKLPIKVFQRDNTLHLARLDKEMLEDGTVVDVPDWEAADFTKPEADAVPIPLDMDEVNRHYKERTAS